MKQYWHRSLRESELYPPYRYPVALKDSKNNEELNIRVRLDARLHHYNSGLNRHRRSAHILRLHGRPWHIKEVFSKPIQIKEGDNWRNGSNIKH